MTDFTDLVEWWKQNLDDLWALASEGGYWQWVEFNRICKEYVGGGERSAYKNYDPQAKANIREEIRALWHDMKEGVF